MKHTILLGDLASSSITSPGLSFNHLLGIRPWFFRLFTMSLFCFTSVVHSYARRAFWLRFRTGQGSFWLVFKSDSKESIHWGGAMQWCSCWAASRTEVSLLLAAVTNESQPLLPRAVGYCFPQQIKQSQWISASWDIRVISETSLLFRHTLLCHKKIKTNLCFIKTLVTAEVLGVQYQL